MQNNLCQKWLAIGITVLFLGLIFGSAVSALAIKNKQIVDMPIGISLNSDGYIDITIEEAWALLNDTSNGVQIPIDVRTDSEWANEHINTPAPENPRHHCVCEWDNETILQEFMSFYEGKEIIIYCRSGGRSVTASNMLVDNGFVGTIYNMLGGINAWKAAGFPTICNQPPDTPTITGATNGKPETEYPYTISSTDPESDDVYYYINWSDGTDTMYIGPYSSGEEVIVNHIWAEKGTYVVKVKAWDYYQAESDWGTLEVSVPKTKAITLSNQGIFEAELGRRGSDVSFVTLEGEYQVRDRFIALIFMSNSVLSINEEAPLTITNNCFEDPSVDFTYIYSDGVGIGGSTAFKINQDDLFIYINAFANNQGEWNPKSVRNADIIIQEYHGHITHYDPSVTATVAKNSNAYVVGNERVISDMLSKGVNPNKLIELSPQQGQNVSTSVLGVKITAFGMVHTYYETTPIVTFAVEMPNGITWYHGGCSSYSSVASYMKNNKIFYDIDVMMLDFEHNFGMIHNEFKPDVLYKVHQYSTTTATMWTDYPNNKSTVNHLDTYRYIKPYVPQGAKLECEGSLSWTEISPSAVVNGEFLVRNVGDSESLLNWKIESYPDWGTWTCTPEEGDSLKPEDTSVTVQVTCYAPDEQGKIFNGDIKIVNTDDENDYELISVSLATPKNVEFTLFFLRFLEQHPHMFPLLRQLLRL